MSTVSENFFLFLMAHKKIYIYICLRYIYKFDIYIYISISIYIYIYINYIYIYIIYNTRHFSRRHFDLNGLFFILCRFLEIFVIVIQYHAFAFC